MTDRADAHLLDLPHHDGSTLHVPDKDVELGETVSVLVRVPRSSGSTSVHARAVHDGEPAWTTGVVDSEDEHDVWWRVDVRAVNPVTSYRFLLDGGPHGYRWLTNTGVHAHDVPDAGDFRLVTHGRPPGWTESAVVYQIFPDRFARSAAADARPLPDWAIRRSWDDPVTGRGPATPYEIYGGDLQGIVEHLDHIESLGADTVYLTPVFPSRSNHRYDASTFDHVDPLLGGDEAYAALSQALHRRGMRLVGDLTANHSGAGHEWFRRAQADPAAPERDYYYFGSDDPDDYQSWLGVRSLPKFDLASEALRRALVEGPDSVTARWMRPPYSIDAWRVDVANMVGRLGEHDHAHDVARLMRATMSAIDPQSLLLAEHGHDATLDLAGDGWHGTMAYAWFTRPVWTWLRHAEVALPFLGLPLPVPRLPGPAVVRAMRDLAGGVPWSAVTASFNLLDSHDTARIRTVVRDPALVRVAAGLMFTMPGMPMVFAGDELGLEGELGEDARRTMPWHRPERWDAGTLATYRELGRLRRTSPALAHGGLRWAYVGDDAIAYLREAPEERLLVLAARAPHVPVRLPAAALGLGARSGGGSREAENLVGGARLVTDGAGSVVLPSDGPDLQVWRLPSP